MPILIAPMNGVRLRNVRLIECEFRFGAASAATKVPPSATGSTQPCKGR